MRAAVITQPGTCSIEDVPRPRPGAGEVVVQVELCGVCGTDLHVLDGEHRAVTFPVIAGHEFVGTVVALGQAVQFPAIGDRVAVDPMIFCGHCRPCRDGHSNLCDNGGGLGTSSRGAFAQYVSVSAAQCEVLPTDLAAAQAALIEPLACAIHAYDRIGAVLDADCLVMGAGPVGLFLARLLQLVGGRVDLLDRNPDRLALAPAFGAQHSATDLADFDHSDGWDVVIDATGNPAAIATGLRAVRKAGRFGVVGVADSATTIEISPYDVFSRELTIIGSNSVHNSFRRAAALMRSGRIPVELLVDTPIPLADINTAFECTRNGIGFQTTVSMGQP
jgi:2-desacetyl-2-hydroxyethyl bacteriochlorophyllide A dehydrogenase